MLNMWTVISYIAATLATASFVPQAIKIFINKNTKGISLYMYIAFTTGVFLWALYGFAMANYAIAISNTISFILSLTIMIFKIINIFKSGEKP